MFVGRLQNQGESKVYTHSCLSGGRITQFCDVVEKSIIFNAEYVLCSVYWDGTMAKSFASFTKNTSYGLKKSPGGRATNPRTVALTLGTSGLKVGGLRLLVVSRGLASVVIMQNGVALLA